MSDKPENQNPDPFDSEDEDTDLTPGLDEQIWPPSEEGDAQSLPSGETADSDWLSEETESDDLGEIDLDVHAVSAGADILAAKVDKPGTPISAHVAEGTSRVRPKSESEIGQLWGSIFFSADIAPPKSIIVTGARRRDGATQIAISLALVGAAASNERRVALVDCNLRNPAIADVLGIASQPGLTDVLDGRVPLEDAMHALALPNGNHLYVLPSGPLSEQPLGLLESRQAQAVIARIQERFDHAIFDVATPNKHPDAHVLGPQTDGALLVVRAGDTPRETIAEAKKRLDLAGVRSLGIVLNQRNDPIPSLLYRIT